LERKIKERRRVVVSEKRKESKEEYGSKRKADGRK